MQSFRDESSVLVLPFFLYPFSPTLFPGEWEIIHVATFSSAAAVRILQALVSDSHLCAGSGTVINAGSGSL